MSICQKGIANTVEGYKYVILPLNTKDEGNIANATFKKSHVKEIILKLPNFLNLSTQDTNINEA